MKKILWFFLSFFPLYGGMVSVNIAPKLEDGKFMGIKILDEKELSFGQIDGIHFSELSDMAYNAKTEILHMISDKGLLFSFATKFTDKITSLKPLRAAKLKNKRGKRFKKWKRDSEGMVLDGKQRLFISFEGKAKVGYFHKNSAKYGQLIRKEKLPAILRDSKNYRNKNKSLESLAWHPKHGLLTATELPLKGKEEWYQTIYTLSNKQWYFKAELDKHSAVVAMEVMEDGNVLVLERAYSGMLQPVVITLKKVYLSSVKQGLCETKVLAKMNNHKGWSIDNFEGLAKVGSHRYVIISDDGDNFFQRTLLLYFEVLTKI